MRASPVTFSESTGLRLCGIAEEPFWPSEKNSSASSTSVRCRWRTSVASRSAEEATTPSVANYMRELYQLPDIAETVKPRYYVINYWSIARLNPLGIIPKGTPVDYTAPHDRSRLSS